MKKITRQAHSPLPSVPVWGEEKTIITGLRSGVGGRQNLCVEPCGPGASSLASGVSGEKGSNMGANHYGIVFTDESTVLYCSPANCHEDYSVKF